MKYVLLLAVLMLAACTQTIEPIDTNIPDPAIEVDLFSEVYVPERTISETGFASNEELNEFINSYGAPNYGGAVPLLTRAMSASADMAESAAIASDFSETNVQVEGIDEADIIKTDGEYIYTITDNTLFIIEAGEDAKVVSKFELEHRPQGLFIEGQRIVVFGYFDDNSYFSDLSIFPRQSVTYFDVYDMSDKTNLQKEKEFLFEGSYFESRMSDGWVYFVVQSTPEYRPVPMPWMVVDGLERTVPLNSVFAYDYGYESAQFATVHSINLESLESEATTVAVEGGHTMYMSEENMYLVNTKYISEWNVRQQQMLELLESELSTDARELIKKIESVDPQVLSRSEKEQKVLRVYYSVADAMSQEERDKYEEELDVKVKEELSKYEAMQYTVLHRLAIDEGKVSLEASGEVPGSVVNQFALDEYENVLRIATTLNENRWFGVEVMDAEIAVAEGERIFSARFVREKLYLVTFRQVDPFFVVDLENPRDIEVLGELKIPGFSRYLHPYDENHIIGIGRDATETGRQEGIKISLFDVSDFENPVEKANWVAENSYSSTTAEWEHKAFLFSRENNLLVLPGYSWSGWREPQSEEEYNGALVFNIDTNDIELRGVIDHAQGERRYGALVERSLYIDDLLYTKSPYLLRVNAIDDLESVQRVTLKVADQNPIVIY
jgi:inhibitor of cysteine peptidase